MPRIEVRLTEKNYQDAQQMLKVCMVQGLSLDSWCSQVIECHLASHRLAQMPKRTIEEELVHEKLIGWRGGQEVKARSSRGVARLQPR